MFSFLGKLFIWEGWRILVKEVQVIHDMWQMTRDTWMWNIISQINFRFQRLKFQTFQDIIYCQNPLFFKVKLFNDKEFLNQIFQSKKFQGICSSPLCFRSSPFFFFLSSSMDQHKCSLVLWGILKGIHEKTDLFE